MGPGALVPGPPASCHADTKEEIPTSDATNGAARPDVALVRKGPWIQTFTGRRVSPFDPKPEDISLVDIAHSLSLIARFAGHTQYFYSVGQHSVLCFMEAQRLGMSPRVQFLVLMHDASEAYLGDILGPVKRAFPGIKMVEHAVQNAIWQAFGLANPSFDEERLVKQVDLKVLAAEARDLMGGGHGWTLPEPASELIVEPWRSEVAERTFIEEAMRRMDLGV